MASIEGLQHEEELHATCANCQSIISKHTCVTQFNVGDEDQSRTAHQVVELIFKGHEVTDSDSNELKFCTPCGFLLGQVIKFYMDFVRVTTRGSYIYNLRKCVTTSVSKITENSIEGPHGHSSDSWSSPVNFSATASQLVRKPSKTVPSRRSTPSRPCKRLTTIQRSSGGILTKSSSGSGPSFRLQRKVNIGKSAAPIDEFMTRDPMSMEVDQDNFDHDSISSCSSPSHETNFPEIIVTEGEGKVNLNYPDPDGTGKMSRRKQKINLLETTDTGPEPEPKPQKIPKAPFKDPYSEELEPLMMMTEYKCDDAQCAVQSISYTNLRDWALHQENEHSLTTGYSRDSLLGSEELKPSHQCLRPCSQCGKKCKTNAAMRLHLKTIHLKVRQYPCHVCGKAFSMKRNVQLHFESIHAVDTPNGHLCHLCGASFKLQTGLTNHMRIHLGKIEKKFKCDICDHGFLSRNKMEDHKGRAHSNSEDRPFQCDKCDYAYKTQMQLATHKYRIHVKRLSQNEVCDLCGKAFSFKNYLKEHLMSVHKMSKEDATISAKIKQNMLVRVLPDGEKVMPSERKPTKPANICSICDRTYVRRMQLFNHLQSVHGKTEEEATEITKFRVK